MEYQAPAFPALKIYASCNDPAMGWQQAPTLLVVADYASGKSIFGRLFNVRIAACKGAARDFTATYQRLISDS